MEIFWFIQCLLSNFVDSVIVFTSKLTFSKLNCQLESDQYRFVCEFYREILTINLVHVVLAMVTKFVVHFLKIIGRRLAQLIDMYEDSVLAAAAPHSSSAVSVQ